MNRRQFCPPRLTLPVERGGQEERTQVCLAFLLGAERYELLYAGTREAFTRVSCVSPSIPRLVQTTRIVDLPPRTSLFEWGRALGALRALDERCSSWPRSLLRNYERHRLWNWHFRGATDDCVVLAEALLGMKGMEFAAEVVL